MRFFDAIKVVLAIAIIGFLLPMQTRSSVEPANQIDIVLTAAVTFLENSRKFNYVYDLQSKPDSQQPIVALNIAIHDQQGINAVGPPSKTAQWLALPPTGDRDLGSPIIDWFPERVITNLSQTNLPAAEAIRPGQTLHGFNAAGADLPGICLFWVKGFVAPPTEQEIVDFVNLKHGTNFTFVSEIPDDFLKEVPSFQPDYINAVSGKTVGPDILPGALTNAQLLDRLIHLKEQAAQLGWIDSEEVVEKLDKKLAAAKDELQEGETRTAANILHSFIHDVEAQHVSRDDDKDKDRNDKDKHINDNGFYLLKPNAEYILSKLEQLEEKNEKEHKHESRKDQ